MNDQVFREACCGRLGIPTEAFEEQVLWHCLHPRGRFLSKLQWKLDRDYFEPDVELLRTVASCTSLSDIQGEVANHRYHYPVSGVRRRFLNLRISGQQLMDFASKFVK